MVRTLKEMLDDFPEDQREEIKKQAMKIIESLFTELADTEVIWRRDRALTEMAQSDAKHILEDK